MLLKTQQTNKNMKKTRIKELNALVTAEAKKLKKNATAKEIKNLSFEELNPTHTYRCIYGQMTGGCYSNRATELIKLSCKKVFKDKTKEFSEELVGELSGSPLKQKRMDYWSPIEIFISKKRNIKNGNNKRLIDFLKDETKTLSLK